MGTSPPSPPLCTSTLDWSSLHLSVSLGVFLVTINTAIGLATHYVRPKYLQRKLLDPISSP